MLLLLGGTVTLLTWPLLRPDMHVLDLNGEAHTSRGLKINSSGAELTLLSYDLYKSILNNSLGISYNVF